MSNLTSYATVIRFALVACRSMYRLTAYMMLTARDRINRSRSRRLTAYAAIIPWACSFVQVPCRLTACAAFFRSAPKAYDRGGAITCLLITCAAVFIAVEALVWCVRSITHSA